MTIDFGGVVIQMAVMLLIVLAGYAARRFRWLDSAAEVVFSQTIVRITAPCLVFYGVMGNRDRLFSGSLPQVMLAVVAAVLLGYSLAFLVFRGRRLDPEHRMLLRFSTMFGNVTFLGIPLCYGLFGQEGLLYASVYAVMQETLFWSVGVAMMGGGHAKADWKKLLNPALIGILIAAVFVAMDIPVPEFVLKTANTVGAATLPLSLMVVGAGFYSAKAEVRTMIRLLPVAGLKLILIPALMAAVLSFVPMEPVARMVLAFEIAMPSAAAGVPLARMLGKDSGFTANAVLLTTALSALTVPLLVLVMNRMG